MLDQLNFVKGAVAKKDFIPNLTHFLIKDGSIKGYNGQLALSSDIDCDLTVSPKASEFIQALNSCEDSITLSLIEKQAGNELHVSSKNFRAIVGCIDHKNFPEVSPEGEFIKVDGDLLDCFKKLEPFVSNDASKPWSCGILLNQGCGYATNNITIIQYWLGYNFPRKINIPHSTIKEILRIGKEPVRIRCSEHRLTIYYSDTQWISTELLSLQWPDISNVFSNNLNGSPVGDSFFKEIERIEPFTDDLKRVYFRGNKMLTGHLEKTSKCVISCEGLPEKGCYSTTQLLTLKQVASRINFSLYPNPCIFYGDNVRGTFVGYING